VLDLSTVQMVCSVEQIACSTIDISRMHEGVRGKFPAVLIDI
jgi:hypothetical protein